MKSPNASVWPITLARHRHGQLFKVFICFQSQTCVDACFIHWLSKRLQHAVMAGITGPQAVGPRAVGLPPRSAHLGHLGPRSHSLQTAGRSLTQPRMHRCLYMGICASPALAAQPGICIICNTVLSYPEIAADLLQLAVDRQVTQRDSAPPAGPSLICCSYKHEEPLKRRHQVCNSMMPVLA